MSILRDAAFRQGLMLLPGNRFEALGRDRKGQFSFRINQQWRICFEWPEKGPTHPIHPGTILAAELQEPNKSVAELAGHGRKAQPPDGGAQGFLSGVILPQLQGLADQADGQTSDVLGVIEPVKTQPVKTEPAKTVAADAGLSPQDVF
jgi:proteic killer suppression protein